MTSTSCPIAPEVHCVAVGSEDNVAVAFTKLPSGVLLTGTPTVTEVSTSNLTLTEPTVNSAAITINGTSYAAGNVVLFHRAGGLANKRYRVKITVSTDASTADVKVAYVDFTVIP